MEIDEVTAILGRVDRSTLQSIACDRLALESCMNGLEGSAYTVIVFCGGRATRLQSRLSGKSKALADIRGEPYLVSLLRWLKRHGAVDIVLCVSPFTSDVGTVIRDGSQFGLTVRYSMDAGNVENAGAFW